MQMFCKLLSVLIHMLFQYLLPNSFKRLLREVTSSKDSTINFMQKNGILKSSVNCPDPLIDGKRSHGCGKPMQMKKQMIVRTLMYGDVIKCIKYLDPNQPIQSRM